MNKWKIASKKLIKITMKRFECNLDEKAVMEIEEVKNVKKKTDQKKL